MAWREFFIPIEPQDPRNADRLNPLGERIRVRFNGSKLDDFVVQYETPVDGQGHAVVLRSDRTHDPHYDRYDRFGRKRTDFLPPHLSPNEIVDPAIVDVKTHWQDMRRTFYEGLP